MSTDKPTNPHTEATLRRAREMRRNRDQILNRCRRHGKPWIDREIESDAAALLRAQADHCKGLREDPPAEIKVYVGSVFHEWLQGEENSLRAAAEELEGRDG